MDAPKRTEEAVPDSYNFGANLSQQAQELFVQMARKDLAERQNLSNTANSGLGGDQIKELNLPVVFAAKEENGKLVLNEIEKKGYTTNSRQIGELDKKGNSREFEYFLPDGKAREKDVMKLPNGDISKRIFEGTADLSFHPMNLREISRSTRDPSSDIPKSEMTFQYGESGNVISEQIVSRDAAATETARLQAGADGKLRTLSDVTVFADSRVEHPHTESQSFSYGDDGSVRNKDVLVEGNKTTSTEFIKKNGEWQQVK